MIIKRLRLQNYCIYGNVDIDLSDVNLTSIVGKFATDPRRSNGSGKSSLINAIRYALFGSINSSKSTDIIRHGTNQCTVDLTVQIDNNELRVCRSRLATGISEANVWYNGQVVADKARTTDGMVRHYLGVDADLFDLIYFFRQDDHYGFVNALPAQRKAYLSRIFDFKDCEKCLEIAKAKLNESKSELLKVTGAIDNYEHQIAKYGKDGELEDELAETNQSIASIEFQRDVNEQFGPVLRQLFDDTSNAASEIYVECKNDTEKIKQLNIKINELTQKIARLKAEQPAIEAQIAAQECGLHSIEQQFGSVESVKLVNLVESKRQLKQLEAKHAHLTIDLISTCDNIKRLRSKIEQSSKLVGQRCDSCQQVIAGEHIKSITESAMHQLDMFVAKQPVIEKELADISANMDQIKSDIERRINYDAMVSQHSTLKQYIAELKRKLNDCVGFINTQSEEISKLSGEFLLLSSNINSAETDSVIALLGNYTSAIEATIHHYDRRVKDDQNQISQLNGLAATYAERIAQRNSLKDQLNLAKIMASRLQSSVANYTLLVEAFGKNGIQALMIENLVGVIEQFANDMLKKMQTRFEVRIKTQKQIQSGEDRETLDVIVLDNNAERDFATYSGGERTMINLALRLALSRLISSMHGVQLSTLFLDEVFAALDQVNREEAVKLISFLSKNFKQVFVISHTDLINDLIPSNIVVTRNSETSEVKIHDRSQTKAA